jgi:deaminated glutathione amidase
MINRLTLYSQLFSSRRDYAKALVGLVQISSGLDSELNFQKNKQNIEMCAQRGAALVCLPENFHYMGRSYTDGIEISEKLSGPIVKRYKQLALDNRIWLSLGGF